MRAVLASLLLLLASPALAADIVSAPAAHGAARAGDVLLVDIRTPGEWAVTGVPRGARPITMHEEGFLRRLEAVTGGRKDRPVALICARGVRSAFMAAVLEGEGYTDVRDVGEGMLGSRAGRGWLARGLPTDAPPERPEPRAE